MGGVETDKLRGGKKDASTSVYHYRAAFQAQGEPSGLFLSCKKTFYSSLPLSLILL